jgi:hypothetical protein
VTQPFQQLNFTFLQLEKKAGHRAYGSLTADAGEQARIRQYLRGF